MSDQSVSAYMMMNKDITQILNDRFGIPSFRPLQKEIIESVLTGHDALVLMPTGGGKSLCYQLPALLLPGITLVVSPLISLMKDQVDALKAKGISAEFLNSSISFREQKQIEERALRGEIKLLYVAPERFPSEYFQSFLDDLKVSLIAIDEAHCISQWGHDFRPDYRNLKMLRTMFTDVPIIALTATATERTRRDIAEQLKMRNGKMYVASFNRPNLRYHVLRKRSSAFDSLVSMLKKEESTPAIIYCLARKDTEMLASDLQEEGLRALPYHAGLGARERKSIQERFLNDETPIICATIAFGMGIDKSDVRTVIHWTMPKDIEGYYQETGRAGRDGKLSECVLFYGVGDAIVFRKFFRDIQNDEARAHAHWRLKQIQRYAESGKCRRSTILSYFSEKYPQVSCKGCDICLPAEERLVVEDETASRRRRSRRRSMQIRNPNSTYGKTRMMIAQKMPLDRIARVRGCTPGTIAGHIENLIEEKQEIDIDYLRPEDDVFEEISAMFTKLGKEKLRPVFDALGEKYPFETLKIVRAIMKSETKKHQLNSS